MPENSRNSILQRLQRAERLPSADRPGLPALHEDHLDTAQLRERFTTQFEAQGGVCCPVADWTALYARLSEIFQAEGITRTMAAEDDVLTPLNLGQWGQRSGVAVVTPTSFQDRTAYTRAVFDQVQAGITGVDFAVAESGTLILSHDRDQARLVSLAPLVHIAVVPADRIIGTYDTAIETLFTDGRRPSQVTFITGPSMTGDIQGTMFKGMHGPG